MKKVKYILIILIALHCYCSLVIAQTSAGLQASVDAGIDPYFVKSTDTISAYGPNCITRDLLQDRHGNIWLATWQGIIKYDGKVFTNYTLKEGLILFHVFSCYEDKKGNLWFGTVRGGLYRYDDKTFTLFTTKDGLADNTVVCFAEDNNGNIWFGTDKGASCYNGKTFTDFTKKDGLPSNNVRAIKLSKTGKLLFGCGSTKNDGNDGGVCCYDGKSFTAMPGKDTLLYNNVTSLLEDKVGNIWVGTYDGLFKYNGKSFKSIPDLPSYLTYYIIEDKKGDIWFSGSNPATAKQTLYHYDGKTFAKVFEKLEPGDNQLFGKIEDEAGNIWFGTMKGVCRYDGKTVTRYIR